MAFLPLIILSVTAGLVLAVWLFVRLAVRPPSPVPVRRFVPRVIEGGGRKVNPPVLQADDRKDAVND